MFGNPVYILNQILGMVFHTDLLDISAKNYAAMNLVSS